MSAEQVSEATAEHTAANQSNRALIVLNPVAGTSSPDQVRATLDTALGNAGWHYEIYETKPDDPLTDLVERARANDCGVVIAAGGDGTVSLVANTLMGTDLTLGILPIGTANVLARELGVADDLEGAAALIAGEHHVRVLDVMQVGERHFLLQIGIGIDSLMIRDTDRESKRRLGRLAYMKTLAGELLGYQARQFTLLIDGRRRRVRAWEVLLANAGTLGVPPFTWGPNISPDDGHLDLCVFNVRSLPDYAGLAWQIITGHHQRGPNARYYRVRHHAAIVADEPLPVQADGEIIGETPITINVVPQAIKVIVPCEPEPTAPVSIAEEAAKDDA